jgi:hypothetical protein
MSKPDNRRVMKWISKRNGIMECMVCGQIVSPILGANGRLKRGTRFCINGCVKEG